MASLSSSSKRYEVVLASDAHQLREAFRIRAAVFHEEQGFPLEVEVDEYDPISAHFVLVEQRGIGTKDDDGGDDSSSAVIVGTAFSGSAHTMPTKDASQIASATASHPIRGTLRWVPYPSTEVPSTIEGAAKGSVSSLLPLGRPPTSQGALATTFASAGGAKLGRLALEKSARGKGLGARLVRESEQWVVQALRSRVEAEAASTAVQKDKKSIQVTFRLHSQMHVISFYEALGYRAQGEPFDEDGAPHLLCVKTVTFG